MMILKMKLLDLLSKFEFREIISQIVGISEVCDECSKNNKKWLYSHLRQKGF